MSDSYEFDTPEVFTAGTVGPPGQRTFFLQVRDGGAVASVKLEKEQVRALAQVLEGMLEDLPTAEPPSADLSLAEPVHAVWAVSSIGVGYDRLHDRVLVVAEESVDDDDTDELAGTVRILLTRGQVRAFIDRADEVVSGGRPPCQWCGQPLNAGRPCPCQN